jgi:hypothetical protein
MTKIFMTVAVALLAISTFSACNKTYRCSCVTTVKVNDSMVSSSTSNKEFRTTKADARNKCSNWSQTSVSGYTMVDSFGTHTMMDTTSTTAECSFR